MNNSGSEILQIAEVVSREKNIPKERIISAMEQSIELASKKKYGSEHNVRVEINRKTGDIKLNRVLVVVENVENFLTQISLSDAQEKNPIVNLGDEVLEPLPPIDLGRVSAQIAKQVITKRVSEAEREKQYYEFKDRVGEIISGVVKRIEFGDVFVDLGGRAEAVIKSNQLIKTETLNINDRVKAYVQDVKLETKGPQIFLSRTDKDFIKKLFEFEVPEIYDGVIQIKSVARDPGSRAKVAIFSSDISIDPVGACVGIRGNRVRVISNELCGEKIDIILWSADISQFIINAFAPIEINKIIIDEQKGVIEAIIKNDDQLGKAIGPRGQNIRLISSLVGWRIDVFNDSQYYKRRSDEMSKLTELYINQLSIDDTIAKLLIASGYNSIDQVANADIEDLLSIEGLSSSVATELKEKAINYIDIQNDDILDKLEALGVEQELLDILYISPEGILALAEYGIKTIEDLAEITVLDFKKLVPSSNLSDLEIQQLIDFASKHNK